MQFENFKRARAGRKTLKEKFKPYLQTGEWTE
jgi:hypothetical protein